MYPLYVKPSDGEVEMAKKVGDIGEEKRCGTLRMGLFFDGTNNDDRSGSTKYTNVKKLFDVYPNQVKPGNVVDITNQDIYPKVMSAYIRGVGSKGIVTVERSRAKLDDDIKRKKERLKKQRDYLESREKYRRKYKIRVLESEKTMIKEIPKMEEVIRDMEQNAHKYISGDVFETLGGGAFGKGGIARLQGMLWYIDVAIREYYKEMQKTSKEGKGHYPKHLEFDIFGFSRGAAQARHFVNVLKQEGNWWKISQDYEQGNVKITSLNLFDTVGSFGIPGKDIDPGFTYYINPSWVSGGITHYIADDEYRYNFDGQVITDNDTEYPIDKPKGKIQEYVVLGSHSDIGGGYAHTKEHGIENNELAKIYLNRMYDRCVELGVPLKKRPKGTAWEPTKDVKNYIRYFEDLYKNKKYGNTLKQAHKKLREWQSARGDLYLDTDVVFEFNPFFCTDSSAVNIEDNHVTKSDFFDKTGSCLERGGITYINELYRALGSDFNLYNDFVKKSNYFHNKYVHISHTLAKSINSFSKVVDFFSFGAETEKYLSILKREYFKPLKEDMKKLSAETADIRHKAVQDNCLPQPSAKGMLTKGNIFTATAQCAVGAGGAYIGSMNQTFDMLQGIEFTDY